MTDEEWIGLSQPFLPSNIVVLLINYKEVEKKEE